MVIGNWYVVTGYWYVWSRCRTFVLPCVLGCVLPLVRSISSTKLPLLLTRLEYLSRPFSDRIGGQNPARFPRIFVKKPYPFRLFCGGNLQHLVESLARNPAPLPQDSIPGVSQDEGSGGVVGSQVFVDGLQALEEEGVPVIAEHLLEHLHLVILQ